MKMPRNQFKQRLIKNGCTILAGILFSGCLGGGSQPNINYIAMDDIKKRYAVEESVNNSIKSVHTSFVRLYKIEPKLAEEIGKLPEFNDGITLKEDQALENIADSFSDFTTVTARKGLDNLLNYGYPDKRKFNSLLQAMFWYSEKYTKPDINNKIVKDNVGAWGLGISKLDQSDNSHSVGNLDTILNSFKIGYKPNIEKILNSLQWFSYPEKWDDFNEVTDRLNSPEMINMWMKNKMRYIFSADLNFQSPSTTFKSKGGNCEDLSIFMAYCLSRAGYNPSLLVIKWEGYPPGHVVVIYKENDKLYYIDNGYRQGIHGPFDSIVSVKKNVDSKWGKRATKYTTMGWSAYPSQARDFFWQ